MSQFKKWLTPLLNDSKVIETSLIMLALWWSFLLILPMDTFGVSPSYDAMKGIASEPTWAVVFFIVAALQFYGMVFEHFHIRMVGLVAAAALWIFISAMFAVSNIATTGTGTYFIVFCLTTYVVYKVGEQRGR